MRLDNHWGGQCVAPGEALQVHLREGDRHVRLLQEVGLLLHRVHLCTFCSPRRRS